MSEGSVLILSKDAIVARLPARLGQEGIHAFAARSARELGALLAGYRQSVAIVDRDLPREELYLINELLTQQGIHTLTLVPPETYARLAVDSGRSATQEFAPKPTSLEELVLRAKALVLRAGFELPPPPSLDQSGRPEGIHGTGFGKVVAVFATKGGVGKSTVAANLAVGLTRFFNFRTLLVDSDLWFGDVGFLFDVSAKQSIFDLCSGDEPDEPTLKDAILQHPTGVSILLRPPDLVAVEKMDLSAVRKLLAVASRMFDFVIVDMRASLDELNLQVLDASDQIVVVTTPEISSVANTSRFLGVAEQLGYDSRVMLVVNRANTGLDSKSIRQTLLTDISCTIVSAGLEVVRAANEGVPILAKHAKDTALSSDLIRIVEKVAGRQVSKQGASQKPSEVKVRGQRAEKSQPGGLRKLLSR